jgi:hypothetical protein
VGDGGVALGTRARIQEDGAVAPGPAPDDARSRREPMARRRAATRPSGQVPAPKRPKTKGSGEGPTSSARGNWIDKVDRAARRPFLEGDYMPTSNKGPRKRARG